MSYTLKYLDDNGVWVDYVEKKSGILTYDGENWIDGASNELDPSVSVSFYDGNKWIRKYPGAQITHQITLKGSNYKFTHTKSSTWGKDTTAGDAKAGVWESGAIYTGWLGLTTPNSIVGGVVADIVDIQCNYTRRGVGYWERPLKLQLVPSTLTKASGTGTNAHSSKRGKTIYSDDGMVLCAGTGATSKGSTTFNSGNAKEMFKSFLNGTYKSLLLGQIENKGDYIGVTAIDLTITYTSNVSSATFVVADTPALASKYTRKKLHTMYIYYDELNMTYDEIMEHRAKNNIKDIKASDIAFR